MDDREENPTFSGLVSLARQMLALAKADKREAVSELAVRLGDYCALKRGRQRQSFLSVTSSRGGMAVSVKVRHRPRTKGRPQVKNPRLFDTVAFPFFQLLHSVGISCTYQHREGTEGGKEDYYYLRLEAPRINDRTVSRSGRRVYVSRVVVDAKPGEQAPFEASHYSYRYHDLKTEPQSSGMPDSELGRQDIINLAREIFEADYPEGREGISADEFIALLTELIAVATVFHATGA